MSHSVLFLLIFTVSLAAANDSDPDKTIRCLLMKDYQKSCNIIGGHPVPSHLIQLFQEIPPETRVKLETNSVYWNLTTKEYAMIHPSFWLLTSIERLSKFPGSNLSSVVLHFPDLSPIAAQVMSSLRTTNQRKDFIAGLNPKSGTLSERVQSVISAALINWDENEWDLPVMVHNANSLLLHFPAECLLISSKTKSSERLLFFVRSWEGFGNDKKWMEQSAIIRRKVAHVFLSNSHENISQWTETQLQKFLHLIPGMTAEELSNLNNNNINLSADAKRNILYMGGLDAQQIRTLFNIFHPGDTLTKSDFMNSVQIATQLSPNQLNKFPIRKLNLKDVKVGASVEELPGMKQLLEMIIASNVLNSNRSLDVTQWGEQIKNLGPLITALPLSDLKLLSSREFDDISLSSFESPHMGFLQANYLTRNGAAFDSINPKLISLLHHLVQALPASTIRQNRKQEVSSRSWTNLLFSLTGENVPRFVSLYQIVESIGMDNSMGALLDNEDNYKMLSYLPSRTLENLASSLSRNLAVFMNEHNLRVHLLPKVLLTLVLNVNRAGPWTWDGLMRKESLNLFLIGLTCSDIQNIETSDLPLIISEYNNQRAKTGHVFPKDLQLCCQQKLLKYLEMKSRLLQGDVNEGLMSMLEPGEIEAFGGYILASLPAKAIASSSFRHQILKSIGQLSVPELMIGLSDSQRSEIINIFFDYHGLNEDSRMAIDETHLFHMGNLTLFLPSKSIKRIKPEALKLLMEINYIDKRVCADKFTRKEWAKLINSAFGAPSEWSGERLSIVGDFLLVMNSSDLSQIRQESWLNAGMSLFNNYGEIIDWIPEDIEYYEACVSLLNETEKSLYMDDLKKLVRWQLIAAQLEFNTIKSASEILKEITSPILSASYRPPVERPVKFNYSMKFLQPPQQISLDQSNDTALEKNGEKKLEDLEKGYNETVEESGLTKDFSMSALGLTENSQKLSSEAIMKIEYTTPSYQSPKPTTADVSDPTRIYPLHFTIPRHPEPDASFMSKGVKLLIPGFEELQTIIGEDQTNAPVENTTTNDNPSRKATENIDREVHLNRTYSPSSVNTTQNFSKSSTSIDIAPKNSTTESITFTTIKPESKEKPTQEVPNKVPSSKNFFEDLTKLFIPIPNLWSTKPSNFPNEPSKSKTQGTQGNRTLDSSITMNSTHLLDPEKIIVPESDSQGMQNSSYSNSKDVYDKRSLHPDDLIKQDVLSEAGLGSGLEEDEEEEKIKIRRSRNSETELDSKQNTGDKIASESSKKEQGILEDLKISCDSLRIVGEISRLAFEESDLEKFTNSEVENCLDVFREMDFTADLKKKIWKRINKNDLHLLGSLLQVAEVEDLEKMNFNVDKPWVMETLSYLSSFPPDKNMINFVLRKVKEDNVQGQIGPDGLISVRGLICDMSKEDRKALLSKPKELKLATAALGQMGNSCSPECLADLAEFAKDYMNFGDPKTYNAQDIMSLGVITAGLNNDDWKELLTHESSVISELHYSAVKCMSNEKLEMIPEEVFQLIPYKTLKFIETEKSSILNEGQKTILSKILNDSSTMEEKLLAKSVANLEDDSSIHEAGYSTIYIAILLFICCLVLIYILFRMRSKLK